LCEAPAVDADRASERRALVVGAGSYNDARLPRLPGCIGDAQAVAAALGDPELGNFRVELLIDPTCRDVQIAIERMCADSLPDDAVLVFYAGHGGLDNLGQLFLLARDTEPDLLRSTAVSTAFIVGCLGDSRSRSKVLILDTSFSGAVLRGVPAPDHITIITSADAAEHAIESSSSDGGFSQFLAQGLQSGDADLDGDGIVTFEELFYYSRSRMSSSEIPSRPRLLNLADSAIVAGKSPKRIFLSYSRGDWQFTSWLSSVLEAAGHRTWLDERGISGGADWRGSITSAIDAAKAVVVVVSPEALASTWVRREIEYAEHMRIPIVPVMARSADLPSWYQLAFGALQRIDLTEETRREEAQQALDTAIRTRAASVLASISQPATV